MTDCNKIQANNIACNEISLTEQWKKGELPEGWYWVKNVTWSECINMLYNWSDTFLDGDVPVDNDKIIEVLAPVPTFEELQNMNKAVNECMAANIKLVEQNAMLEERNDSLNNRDINLCRIANGIRDENFALKELLKECELWFTGMVGNMNDKNVGEHNKSVPIGNFEHIFKEFSQKIKGALK